MGSMVDWGVGLICAALTIHVKNCFPKISKLFPGACDRKAAEVIGAMIIWLAVINSRAAMRPAQRAWALLP